MNQLKDWGFSTQWWRGEKGEYWVIAQGLLFLGFILLPIYPVIGYNYLSREWQIFRWGVIIISGGFAGLLFLRGIIDLGHNLTPLPHPKDEGTLVTTGIYGLVRHPLYSGVIFGAIAYGCWQWSLTHVIGSVVFLLFFDFKARKEESWLKNKFSDYHSYQLQVKKFIPWIY
jgi:protein-S-isoprenylcysteine O-methyltransferase Ste14